MLDPLIIEMIHDNSYPIESAAPGGIYYAQIQCAGASEISRKFCFLLVLTIFARHYTV